MASMSIGSFIFHKMMISFGPALMAVWSKALPLTASCLSPLPGFESLPGQVASDLGLGGGFRRVLWFPPPNELTSHNIAAIWQKTRQFLFLNSKLSHFSPISCSHCSFYLMCYSKNSIRALL